MGPVELTRTEHAVLGLLAWGGEASGYDLHRRAEQSVGFVWTPVRSHLYVVLRRLADARLVEVRHVDQQGKPDKQIHAINDAGRTALRMWVDTVDPIDPGDRDGLLLKVFFARYGTPGSLDRQLEDFRNRSLDRLGTYLEIEHEIVDGGEHLDDPHPLIALRMGIALTRTNLAWIDETIALLADVEARLRS